MEISGLKKEHLLEEIRHIKEYNEDDIREDYKKLTRFLIKR